MPASALSRPRNGVTAALWVMLVLFILRVVGQFLIAVGLGDFLPPWGEWYSGLLPYSWLLASQIVIVLACGKVCLDFSRGRGFFVRPSRALGSGLVAFGSVYMLVMVIRYVMRMSLYPHERWTGGAIPIFFHWVGARGLSARARDVPPTREPELPARRDPVRRRDCAGCGLVARRGWNRYMDGLSARSAIVGVGARRAACRVRGASRSRRRDDDH